MNRVSKHIGDRWLISYLPIILGVLAIAISAPETHISKLKLNLILLSISACLILALEWYRQRYLRSIVKNKLYETTRNFKKAIDVQINATSRLALYSLTSQNLLQLVLLVERDGKTIHGNSQCLKEWKMISEEKKEGYYVISRINKSAIEKPISSYIYVLVKAKDDCRSLGLITIDFPDQIHSEIANKLHNTISRNSDSIADDLKIFSRLT